MLKATEARAPQMRNLAVMQMWFDAWNADNERAREAYDEVIADLEAKAAVVADGKTFPRMCGSGEHPLQSLADVFGEHDRCRRCRNRRDRERRRGVLMARGRVPAWRKITDAQAAEIIQLYTVDLVDLRRIGLQFGLSHVAVRKILLRTGTTLRTPSESARLRWKNKEPGELTA